MAVTDVLPVDARVMHAITRHLESLKETHDGDELRSLILRILRRHSTGDTPNRHCLTELYQQLETYASDAVVLPNMRIRARLLQQHIAPYLPEDDSMDETNRGPLLQLVTTTPADAATTAPMPVSLAAQALDNNAKDQELQKQAWLRNLDELALQREALEQKLKKTTEQLTLLQVEHERLSTELDKARREGRRPRVGASARHAHRPTQLPKYDAFLRLLDIELKRARRSAAPIVLGLLEIRGMSGVVERYGAGADEAVLRCYAQEVFVNFRAHDIVAVYGENAFAVLFPDTSKEGAQRALEKAYKRASDTWMPHETSSFPLPPFTGVLAPYTLGEDPTSLLRRAQQSLEAAKRAEHIGVFIDH